VGTKHGALGDAFLPIVLLANGGQKNITPPTIFEKP
jgi:hypothetical protein